MPLVNIQVASSVRTGGVPTLADRRYSIPLRRDRGWMDGWKKDCYARQFSKASRFVSCDSSNRERIIFRGVDFDGNSIDNG